jgi:hypothetical protein
VDQSDQTNDLANDKGLSVAPATSTNMGKQACGGNLVIFPPGKNQHTSYPFGLHNEQIIPWNYHSIDESFYLQARSCTKELVDVGEACTVCDALKSTSLYDGIIHRMEHGVHENTPLAYHGVGGLVVAVRRKIDQVRQMRLTKLNTEIVREIGNARGSQTVDFGSCKWQGRPCSLTSASRTSTPCGDSRLDTAVRTSSEQIIQAQGLYGRGHNALDRHVTTWWRTCCRVCTQIVITTQSHDYQTQHHHSTSHCLTILAYSCRG